MKLIQDCDHLPIINHPEWVTYFDQIGRGLKWTSRHLLFLLEPQAGTHSTNDISIKWKIQSKFLVLWFKECWTDHNGILHKSPQCYCRDVYKILLWSVEYIMNYRTTNFV